MTKVNENTDNDTRDRVRLRVALDRAVWAEIALAELVEVIEKNASLEGDAQLQSCVQHARDVLDTHHTATPDPFVVEDDQ